MRGAPHPHRGRLTATLGRVTKGNVRPALPLLACAALAVATPARAQRDPSQVVRLSWPVANVLVYPDSESGVGVWVATNPHAAVHTNGRVDMSTFTTVLSDDPGFEEAVKRSLKRARFHPATIDGRPVEQLVCQRFVFRLH